MSVTGCEFFAGCIGGNAHRMTHRIDSGGFTCVCAHFCAGATGILVGHPLDTIKTWQQATNVSIGRSMYKIVTKNNGVCVFDCSGIATMMVMLMTMPLITCAQINGFYRGMMFPLWTTGAVNALMFGVYGNQLRMLQHQCETPREKERLLLQHVFVAGTAAGFVQAFLACPFELIKIKLQTHKCEWVALADYILKCVCVCVCALQYIGIQ